MMSVLQDLYRRGRLSRFVVDEAHCLSQVLEIIFTLFFSVSCCVWPNLNIFLVYSCLLLQMHTDFCGSFDLIALAKQWGHDFRPDYLKLNILRQDFPSVPIMALTATANSSVVSDISSKLAMRRDFFTFKSSFNRPNLRYTILKKTKTSLAEIATYIKTKQFGKSGIIYCLSRKNCEQVSDELKKALPQMANKITYYHAELEADERARRHTQWTRGNIKLIVATVSVYIQSFEVDYWQDVGSDLCNQRMFTMNLCTCLRLL